MSPRWGFDPSNEPGERRPLGGAYPAILALLLGLGLAAPGARAVELNDPEVLTRFVGTYCLDCHDRETEKGDREFETLTLPLHQEADLITAKDMIDQLTLREMPPSDEDQPTDEERIAVIRILREHIADARGKIRSTAGRTVLRRLSNREYERTLAVLFGRRVDTLGLTTEFPRESASEHIDTIGQSLVTSGFLLDHYFQAANRLVETRLGKPSLPPQAWHFKGNFVQYEELQGPHKEVFDNQYLCLYEQPNTDTRQGGYGHIEDFLQGVPVSGLYEIEVLAQAMHRDTHYDPAIFGIDFSEPFQIGVVPGDFRKNHIHYPQTVEPVLARAVVSDAAPQWITFRVWLEAGQTPRFIFPNGPYESRKAVLALNKRYAAEYQGKPGVNRTQLLRLGKLPHIRIGEIKINGPLVEPGGSAEEVAVFGPGGFRPEQALAQLESFGQRAYRRPLSEADRATIRRSYEAGIAEKAAPRQAALDTLKMMLCSPSFLYLSELTAENETRLGAFDLATRLSYALWGEPPDAELMAAAASGRLTETDELMRQSRRLLADERVGGFVHGFLDAWLRLREIGGMPPPRETMTVFYAENLSDAMKTEARLFFGELLRENGSVRRLLDADYTFADKRLARLYKLPEKDTLRQADGFRRVSLAGSRQRGGVLGMAAVLTVSANGVETSPVTRGVWVMENVLGTKPPPPPDEVPAIDPDVTGATTIRERLAMHRNDAACAECHRKIDPLGFSLESFDPIGRWRTTYPKVREDAPELPVDASGEFGSGEAYTDFHGFKQILNAERGDIFARHLIKQVLSYSAGRHLEPADDYVVEEILQAVKADDYGLQTLVLEVIGSEVFRSR